MYFLILHLLSNPVFDQVTLSYVHKHLHALIRVETDAHLETTCYSSNKPATDLLAQKESKINYICRLSERRWWGVHHGDYGTRRKKVGA